MIFPPGVLAAIYLANAVLVFIVARGIARRAEPDKRPIGCIAALSLLFFVDACLMLWIDCTAGALGHVVVVFCLAAPSFPDALMRGLSRALERRRFGIYVASVFTIAAIFHIYLPITTFLTSPGELSIHLDYLIKSNAKRTMVIVYVASALYAFATSPRLKALLTLIAFSCLLLTVVYAYAYPFGYPMLSGLVFEQIAIEPSVLVLRGGIDALTVLGAVACAIVAVRRVDGNRILLAITLLNASLILTSVVTVAKDREDSGALHASSAGASNARPIRFAKDKNNVLVIFLDRFMGGFVEEILQEEPALATDLDGFVWYPRTLAPGENSIAGVHAMLGGYDYTPRQMNERDRPLRDLSVESFAILPYNFTKKGYAANLVSPRGLGFTMEGDCSFLDIEGLDCVHIPASVTKALADEYNVPMRVLADSMYADLLVLLGMMRGTPYMTRAVLHERGPWRPFLDHSAGTTFKQWAELKSLHRLSATGAERGNINIVFNMLPHEPYFMGEDCIPRATQLKAPPEALQGRHSSTFAYQHYVAARCSLRIVGDYMKWLQQAGVYDNTKIVIVSDHGIVGPVEDRSSRAVAGGTTSNAFVRSRSVLLVKDRDAHGPVRASEEFMPNAEVPRIVCDEIGGCVNPYMENKTIAAHGRDLPFFVDFVPWQFNLQEPKKFKILQQMVLERGDPYDATAWRRQPAPNP